MWLRVMDRTRIYCITCDIPDTRVVEMEYYDQSSPTSCVESERYIIRTKNVREGRCIMSYPDVSVIAAGHEMPMGDDRAPVQTQAESRKNGRIARREAPDNAVSKLHVDDRRSQSTVQAGFIIGI